MSKKSLVDNFSLSQKLTINESVELSVPSGQFEGDYSTQIVDIKSDDRFVINAPMSQGYPVKVPTNKRAEIKAREENGIYILPIKVVSHESDRTPLLIVELVGQVKRVQQRQFFRLDIDQRTHYRVVADDLEEFESMFEFKVDQARKINLDTKVDLSQLGIECLLHDMSAGGVGLATKEEILDDQIVEIDFSFMDVSFETLFGKVVRADKVTKNDIEKYEAGIKFLNSDRQYRDEMTQWLFAKQRELRQKGLI